MINYAVFIGLGFLILCAFAQVRPPNFSPDSIPETSFTCEDKITGGYYADVEADCQLFHVCVQVSEFEFQDFRFLCPNDTVFDQQNLVCTNWFEVDCAQSVSLFSNDFGFKDLSGGSEKSEKFDYNYNDGISYEYYEYESEDQKNGNRFLVNSSPASSKGNPGVGREHGQGFLGGDGKLFPHSSTAIPVGVTTTKRPPRVKSNINLRRNHPSGKEGRQPSHRFRNPFRNPPKKAADGRRPRVKSDIRQRHHGGSNLIHSKKNKLGKKVQISEDEFNFADPIDNDIFSGPEVRPDGRQPRVKSNINAFDNNNNNEFPSTISPFHSIPKESPTTESFAPTPFEEEDSLNTIEFSSDLFPSSTSQPFIQQHAERPQISTQSHGRFNEKHRSFGRGFNNHVRNEQRERTFLRSSTATPFFASTKEEQPSVRSSTQAPFVSSTTVLPFVSTSENPGFKVPFITRDQEVTISSTVKPNSESSFKFINNEEDELVQKEDSKRLRVPFTKNTNLLPPQGSLNFRPPFISKQKSINDQKESDKTSEESSNFKIPFVSRQPNSIGSSEESKTRQPLFSSSSRSTTQSTGFRNSFSTTSSPQLNGRFSSGRPSSFNGGISTSKPSGFRQRFSSPKSNFVSASTISALSQSFSSSTYSPSSTSKRSILSTTASPIFDSSTSAGFFNALFTTRSPGSSPRVKSNIMKQKELTEAAIEETLEAQQKSSFSPQELPKFIDEIDEFETPSSFSSPAPFISSTSPAPFISSTNPAPFISSTSPAFVRGRKRVTKRRKVLRKKGFGNDFRGRQSSFRKTNNLKTRTNNNFSSSRQTTQPQSLTESQVSFNQNSQNEQVRRNQGRLKIDSQSGHFEDSLDPKEDFKATSHSIVTHHRTKIHHSRREEEATSEVDSKQVHRNQNFKSSSHSSGTSNSNTFHDPRSEEQQKSQSVGNSAQLLHSFSQTTQGSGQESDSKNRLVSPNSDPLESLIPNDEDESFNDITGPGGSSIRKNKECNDPFKCPPKKRAGGHRPRVKSNIQAKSRNFHFQHKLGRKITDSNTIRSQNHHNDRAFSSGRPKPHPKPSPKSKSPLRNQKVEEDKAQPQREASGPQKLPAKGQLPNRPLSKNQFLSFLSSIGNASPIITVNSKTGKLSSFPGSPFSNEFPGSIATKGVSSSSIQNVQASTPTSFIQSSSPAPFFVSSSTPRPEFHSTLSPSPFSTFQSTPRPSLSSFSPIEGGFQSSPRPGLGNSFPSNPSTTSFSSKLTAEPRPSPPSEPRSLNRFSPHDRTGGVASTTAETFIASSTHLSISTTPSSPVSQQAFFGSTTYSPAFSSPRSSRVRFKGRRSRPAPFTRTFGSTSSSVFQSPTTPFSRQPSENEIASLSSTPLPETIPPSTTPVNPIFLPPTPANKILTINDIINIVATESPKRQPRVKSNILLSQRNSGRRSRRVGGRRADFGGFSSSEPHSVGVNSDDEEKTELFFAGSTTPSAFRVSSTTKRSIAKSEYSSLDQKDISTTKRPLVVRAKDVSLGQETVHTTTRTTESSSSVATTTTTTSTTTTQSTTTASTTSTLPTTVSDNVKEELMELHQNMTDIDAKIEYNNKNDKEPVVRPDGQAPRVKSNLLFNIAEQQRQDRKKENRFRSSFQKRRPTKFSFNRIKSAIQSRNIPEETSPSTQTSSEPTTTPFYPTIPTEETIAPKASSSEAPTETTTLETTTSTSTTSTKKSSLFKDRFNRYKNKGSQSSNTFLKNFLNKQRRRNGFFKSSDEKSSTTTTTTSSIRTQESKESSESQTTPVASDIVR